MADAGSSIFNKKATEKLRSPDDLDKYVRVTNPSVWVVMIACIALVLGLLSWGIFGSVSTSVSSTAAKTDSGVICFINSENVSKVHLGDPVNVDGELMRVESVSPVPSSREEAKQMLDSDYLVSTLVKDDWVYVVKLDGDTANLATGLPLKASITVERVAPITLVFGSAA